MARLPVHRERRAGQQIPAPEAHLEESAAVEPASRRAAHRTRAHRACAGRPTELPQEVERHVALNAAPQLPAREPAPEPRLARRLKPLLDVLDHVHRRRPPEPRQQRTRQRVPVLDRPGRVAVRQPAAGGTRQRQRQCLLVLVVRVVEHPDLDRPRGLARLERQRPAGRRVVDARLRRTVRRGVVHRQRPARGAAERHREGQHRAGVLLHPRIRRRDPHRAGDRRRQRVRQRPAVARADSTPRVAVGRLRQPDRHRLARVRLDRDLPAAAAARCDHTPRRPRWFGRSPGNVPSRKGASRHRRLANQSAARFADWRPAGLDVTQGRRRRDPALPIPPAGSPGPAPATAHRATRTQPARGPC